jgi:hypothetical protein
MAYREVLRRRAIWPYAAGLVFLHRPHGRELATLGPPLVVIYLLTDGQHYWRLAVRFSDRLASCAVRGLRGRSRRSGVA